VLQGAVLNSAIGVLLGPCNLRVLTVPAHGSPKADFRLLESSPLLPHGAIALSDP